MSSSIFRFVNGHDAHPEVTERLARVAHATVDRFAERAAEMEQDLRARASILGSRAEKRARAVLNTQLRGARGYVRKQPLSGAGIALAAGVVIGGLLLLRR
jgi:ElaB/YqjD/DUF883 family membrane-anchored ribosome-binding protein